MQVKFQLSVHVVRGEAKPRSRRRRLLLLGGLLALALAAAAPFALAAGLISGFSDVPPSNPNHDAIDRVTNAGIMTPCQTSPQLLFCPTTQLGRQWAAANYDRILGLSGTPGNFTPTFRALNVQNGGSAPPFTVDSGQKVVNLNADLLDGIDSSGFYAAGSKVTDSQHADNADNLGSKPASSYIVATKQTCSGPASPIGPGGTFTLTCNVVSSLGASQMLVLPEMWLPGNGCIVTTDKPRVVMAGNNSAVTANFINRCGGTYSGSEGGLAWLIVQL